MARADRRRRVLNEEVLAAGAAAADMSSEDAGDTPRYGEQANIENHPQITDFVPRRYRTVLLTVLVGLAAVAGAESLARYADKLNALLSTGDMASTFQALADRMVAWSSAVVLLLAAAFARVTYMLRQHRVDDYRGRYRMWRLATWLGVALSVNAVVGLHEPISRVLGQLTGWQLLAGNVGWWLGAALVVCLWVVVRLVLDMAECRGALSAAILAIGCYAAAGVVVATGWSPEWLGAWAGATTRSLPFVGHLLMLAAVMLNARYVVRDVQGLITHRPSRSPKVVGTGDQALQTGKTDQSASSSGEKPAASNQPSPAPAKVAERANTKSDQSTQWIDGSEQDDDSEHNSGQKRRLSKAERKRLRKLKARNAA